MFNQGTPAALREMLDKNRERTSALNSASIPEGESPGPEMFQQLLNQQKR
jgi:hypothetical protein